MPLTVGTAGHIDHGKTWLVRALTGKDTDRLPEEQARGISIDLGYAPLQLTDGRQFSLVDEDPAQLRVDHGMGTAFAQAEHFDLRVGGVQALADTATEGVFVVGGVGDVELDTVDGHHPQIPQPGTRGARPGQRPGHPCVEFADWRGTQAGAGLAQRRGGGHLPVLVPGPKEPQPLDEFAHHLFVGVVEEQRHRQHEVHHDPGRQQPASALGAVGLGQHLVDQIAVHQSGQHTQADPVGQPALTTVFTTRIFVDHECQ